MNIAVIGAGGHGRVAFDLINSLKAQYRAAFFDDGSNSIQLINGMELKGTVEDLLTNYRELKIERAIVSIGDNQSRRKIFQRVVAAGLKSVVLVHPKATISSWVTLNEGTMICGHAWIGTGTEIGTNCIVNTAATVDHDCLIEAHVHLSPGVHLAGGVNVGEETFIGTGACVIQGIHIGRCSIVGAGAVVIRDLPADVIAVGVPARIIEKETFVK